MGFAPASAEVRLRSGRTDSLVFSLTALATTLAGVLVEDEYEARSHRLLAGFWERRSRGFGYFLTRDEIEKREAQEFTDLARMVPSVTIATMNGRKVIRFHAGGNIRDCPPQYVVDGMRIENGSPDEFIAAGRGSDRVVLRTGDDPAAVRTAVQLVYVRRSGDLDAAAGHLIPLSS